MSANVVRATLSSLFDEGVIDVRSVGISNGTIPNYFKVNFESFKRWESISIEEATKNPIYRIHTQDYSAKGWKPSYLEALTKVYVPMQEASTMIEDRVRSIEVQGQYRDSIDNSSEELSKIEHNIDYADNVKNNKVYDVYDQSEIGVNENNSYAERAKTEAEIPQYKSSRFQAYKVREDDLMDKLMKTKEWFGFRSMRSQIYGLMEDAVSEDCLGRTQKRLEAITKAKMKYFIPMYEHQPYRSELRDFYEETGCGWKGKQSNSLTSNSIDQRKAKPVYKTQNNTQSSMQKSEAMPVTEEQRYIQSEAEEAKPVQTQQSKPDPFKERVGYSPIDEDNEHEIFGMTKEEYDAWQREEEQKAKEETQNVDEDEEDDLPF
ncbi:MAG: hypothetical protein LIO91_02590 [Bacteroidales bacterium]|nr:hypothetical protein [Bacteroidales bacterium]